MMNLDERIEQISFDNYAYCEEEDFVHHNHDAKQCLPQNIKQLIRDVLEEVKPEPYTEHPDMNSQENGYNMAIDNMEDGIKELGLDGGRAL